MLNRGEERKVQKNGADDQLYPAFPVNGGDLLHAHAVFERRTGVFNEIIEVFGGTRQEFLTVPRYFGGHLCMVRRLAGLGWGAIIYMAALSAFRRI